MIDFKYKGKVDKAKANTLLNAMVEVALHPSVIEKTKEYLPLAKEGKKYYAGFYHSLRALAEFDLSYDDSHPAYSKQLGCNDQEIPARVRRVAYIGWKISEDYYHSGVDDSHWFTVQKAVEKQFLSEIEKKT